MRDCEAALRHASRENQVCAYRPIGQDSTIAAEHRLATYGSLAPGRVNHYQLAGLEGTWRKGTVRGTLVESGWEAALGFPGLLLDESGVAAVNVLLFESPDRPLGTARRIRRGGGIAVYGRRSVRLMGN
ncbi:hypothetical protein RGR602_PC01837 (plasmid) [Rhizobium gallicum bv. gallicum R602sp]|uniref:Uncharacterized protein n=1 Tax=Rhizobium gallicum bv. gallicum R602sp TaxID=1041138 RepID=A0A0B4XFI0_9HYPH|nr:hypothetical protein RGR602_PC01837 [Rhizobium gallicum bv. gallicum R602sp]